MSCTLDVADLGGVTLEVVGDVVNLTRERIRQIEVKAFRLLKRHKRRALDELRDAALDAHQTAERIAGAADHSGQLGSWGR